jgi:hypothetical protein
MKTLPIIAVLCALAFGGCSSLNHSDRSLLQAHGVGGPLYDKMMHGEPLELADIIRLSHKGLPPPFIISYLRDTYFVYHLKPSDVQDLQRAGVAREVVDYLMATPGMYAPRIPPVYPYGPYGPYDSGYYGYGPYGPYGPSPYFYPGYRDRRW